MARLLRQVGDHSIVESELLVQRSLTCDVQVFIVNVQILDEDAIETFKLQFATQPAENQRQDNPLEADAADSAIAVEPR